jgi:DNA polymerase elongation subunit (family B)
MVVRKEFTCAVQAQEFYLKQTNQLYWHWDYDNGKYILERKINENTTDDIIKIEEIQDSDYVYDIETEDGTFQCGPGCMIIKNTDSIYTKFTLPNEKELLEQGKETYLKKIFEVSQECADRISKTFKEPIELEMEKVMWPLILFGKKRYVNLCWESYEKPKKIDAKGIQLVRRDNCPFVKTISNAILEKIMYQQDIKGAEEYARTKIKELLEGKVPIKDLVISKSLKESYKDTNKNGQVISKPAHWHLAEKMRKRDPMTAPNAGDRVPFIFIENTDKNALQMDRVEDPEWAEKNKIPPDVLYYLAKQIENPLITLFELIVKDKNGLPYPDTKQGMREVKKEIERLLWANAKRRKENKLKGQTDISSFFQKRLK